MNLENLAEVVTLFVGVFILVNLFFFLSGQYSIHFQTEICQNISGENLTSANLPQEREFYQKSCNSVLDAWKHTLEPPLTLKYHVAPLIISLIVALPLLYYRVLESEFNERGVQNWDERKP
jgi:uncharacterized protein YhhL (DUF1145 family)